MRRRLAALPRRVVVLAAALTVLAVGLLVAFLAAGGGPGGVYGAAVADPVPYDGRSPAQPATGRERVLVELPRPALGELKGLGSMDGAEQRAYVRSLEQEAAALVSALRARGVQLRDVVTFTRAWHGFAATVRPRDRPGLESLGVRVRPDRRLFPALSAPVPVAAEAPAAPPAPPRGAPAVSLLAGGVADVRGGYDAVGRDTDPAPARGETGGEPLAAELRALGARVRVVRVSGVRRDDGLTVPEEHGTTDQLLDGLEHVVDPDADGDTADHDDVALVGVSSPYAGFADAPEAQALRGAARIGTLTVACGGHEGPGTAAVGTIGSPGAAAAALTVGPLGDPAAVARTTLRVGDVTVQGAAILAGAPPRRPLRSGGPVEADTPDALLRRGSPALQGRLAVVQAGANPSAQAAAAAAAGAAAVLLARPDESRPLPAMPAGRVPVPVLGVTGAGARAVLELDGDEPARVRGLTVPRARTNLPFGTRRPSPFASRGPTFEGAAKPELSRPASVIAGGRLVAGAAVAAAPVAVAAARLAGAAPAAVRRARLLTAAGAAPTPSPTPAGAPDAVPVGRLAVRRERGATGVAFTVGRFERGDAAAGVGTTLVPAARLELVLEDGGGRLVERLTPPGGERGVLPGEYAYTLRPAVLRRLDRGRYRFRVRARAPRQRTVTTVASAPFAAG